MEINLEKAINDAKKLFSKAISENKESGNPQKVFLVPVDPNGNRGDQIDITDKVIDNQSTCNEISNPYDEASAMVPGIIFESPHSYFIDGMGSYNPIIYKKMFGINTAYAKHTTDLINEINSDSSIDYDTMRNNVYMHNSIIQKYRESTIGAFSGMYLNAISSLYTTLINMINIEFNKNNSIMLIEFKPEYSILSNDDNNFNMYLLFHNLIDFNCDEFVENGGVHLYLVSRLNDFSIKIYNNLCYQLNIFTSSNQFRDESIIEIMFDVINKYFAQFMINASTETNILENNILNVYESLKFSYKTLPVPKRQELANNTTNDCDIYYEF